MSLNVLFAHLRPGIMLSNLLGSTYHFPSVLIPLSLAFKHGLKDGDCAEALMIPEMGTALDYIKKNGHFPVSRFHTA